MQLSIYCVWLFNGLFVASEFRRNKMNELKDIYDIELSDIEVLKSALQILNEESDRTEKTLAVASNKHQRVEALTRQEAIAYILKCIGGR